MHRRMMMQSIGGVNPFQDATVAYSLRDLDLGATHVVRVRRDSDDTEQDFTATEITDGTLTSFCGAGNGFVSIWYEQTGVYDASQATATSQPKIVNAGALILEGGKPALDFDGVNDFLMHSGSVGITGTTPRSMFNIVTPKQSTGHYFSLNDGTTSFESQAYILTAEWALRVYGGNEIYNSATINFQYLTVNIFNGTNVTDNNFYLNGVEKLATASTPITLNTNDLFLRVGASVSVDYFEGKIQETIVFATDKSAERPDIETNINNFYNIY